ncbi:MAG: NAD-dependent epimerase/dehydratase family protein [Bacteroidales bacterium]|jgi:dTDP-L-rhamnose 4-epimerase|nr:NAD-dependent epimerase/dehydratase family protein [Bacteroidales bacterium]
MKKILITGGAGFIGSRLALNLLSNGYEVTVLDNLSSQIHGNAPETESPLYRSIENKVVFIRGSVTDYNVFRDAAMDQDVVVHFAAETGTGQSMYEIKKYMDVNVGGTANLLDILVKEKHSVKKVIVASSRAIYGEGKYFCSEHENVFPASRNDSDLLQGDFECKCPYCQGKISLLPTSEDSLIHPSSIYGITKQTQEEMLFVVCKSIMIPVVAFRYQNVYGPGQSLTNPYTGILSIFSSLLMNEKEINIFEDGQESRDFVYIDDVVEATISGIIDHRADNEAFNVGTGIPTTVLQVVNVLAESLGVKAKIKISGNFRNGDIRHNYADLKKIGSKLNYLPGIPFQTGIREFVKWAGTQKFDCSNYTDSLIEMKKLGLFK